MPAAGRTFALCRAGRHSHEREPPSACRCRCAALRLYAERPAAPAGVQHAAVQCGLHGCCSTGGSRPLRAAPRLSDQGLGLRACAICSVQAAVRSGVPVCCRERLPRGWSGLCRGGGAVATTDLDTAQPPRRSGEAIRQRRRLPNAVPSSRRCGCCGVIKAAGCRTVLKVGLGRAVHFLWRSSEAGHTSRSLARARCCCPVHDTSNVVWQASTISWPCKPHPLAGHVGGTNGVDDRHHVHGGGGGPRRRRAAPAQPDIQRQSNHLPPAHLAACPAAAGSSQQQARAPCRRLSPLPRCRRRVQGGAGLSSVSGPGQGQARPR